MACNASLEPVSYLTHDDLSNRESHNIVCHIGSNQDCCGEEASPLICHVCRKFNTGHCPYALARLGPVHSLVSVGVDLCGDNCLTTEVQFDVEGFPQVVCSAPPHSKVLIGSTVDSQVFNDSHVTQGQCAHVIITQS